MCKKEAIVSLRHPMGLQDGNPGQVLPATPFSLVSSGLMLSRHARAPALGLALIAALAGGCGDDDGGGGPPDASAPDGGGIDAEDLCPGLTFFEAFVADAVTGDPVDRVTVGEVGGADSRISAPNGRADLCLPNGADSTLRSTKDGYLDRIDTLSSEAVAVGREAQEAYPLDVLSDVDADSVLGLVREPGTALLMVSVVSYPDGTPVVGASVSLEAGVGNDGAFARDAGGQFMSATPGQEVADGRIVLFANVELTGGAEPGRVVITVNPPADFDGSCAGPPSTELEAGGVSGAFFACH